MKKLRSAGAFFRIYGVLKPEALGLPVSKFMFFSLKNLERQTLLLIFDTKKILSTEIVILFWMTMIKHKNEEKELVMQVRQDTVYSLENPAD